MFSVGSYLKIWEVQSSKFDNNYVSCKASTSYKHHSGSGSYVTDFNDFVNILFGSDLKPHDIIIIDQCGVSNKYDKVKKRTYVNYYVTKWHRREVVAPSTDIIDTDINPFEG